MRLTVRALIESIGCDGLTRRMIRVAIQESDELKIDPEVSPYKEMIAQETRWWAYPEKAAVENKQAAAIITKMGKTAVEAKQAAEKKKESRAAAAEEAEVQESSTSDESNDDEVSLNVRSKKGASQQKQVTFEDKTECNYAGCK